MTENDDLGFYERLIADGYAWPAVADYEKEVGFEVNDVFKAAWDMARTRLSNESTTPAAQPAPEPPMTGREMYQRGYAAAERDLKRELLSIDWAEAPENTAIAKVALFWVTEDNLMLGRKDLASIEKPVNGADGG